MEETAGSHDGCAIWTPDRRLRVFISSTLAELGPERAAARAAIEALHLTPVLFELGARPHPPRALYAAYIEQSEVFVGIYWQHYGWRAPGATVSGLEDEYNLSSKLPRLLYVKEPAPDREPELAILLERFEADASVSYRKFTDTGELARLIADDLAVLLSERFGAVATRTFAAQSVPVPLTPTIGRRREIAKVAGLLRRGCRLVTITGTGGVGKTRLAIAVARELAAEDKGDVFFIPLASLTEPSHIVAAIAEHVGARLDTPNAKDCLAAQLRERRALLVLDNFEHLSAAAADVSSLLDQCADLQVLVTSRHVLRLRGEHEFALAPLETPARTTKNIRNASAVKLFVDRAAAVRPGFGLTAANEQPVAELCRRLDGLPLAIELAAARLRLLEPDELLDRLRTRLDLLSSATADLPERQRALRATLDWSYNLLSPAERCLFARLSVFAGGATLVAAEAVCGDEALPDVLEVMASLLEKSLLVHVPRTAGPARFEMLHVVRAYAWEQLAARGETETLRERHARWLLDALVVGEHTLPGDQRFERFDVEIDNLRALLEWVLEQQDLPAAAVIAREVRSWWWRRGMLSEGLVWLDRAANLADRMGRDTVEHGWIRGALGLSLEQAGRVDEAESSCRTALEIFVAHDDDDGIIFARLALASVRADEGHFDEAVALALETLEQARRAHNDGVIEWASSILGMFFVVTGELDSARAYQEEARDAAARVRSGPYLAMAHHQLALIELMAGQAEECWRELGHAAEIYEHDAHLDGVSYALEIAAAACLADDEVDEALEAAAVANDLHDRLRLPVWPVLRPQHDRLEVELTRATRGRDRPSSTRSRDPTALLARLCDRHSRR